jgi:hypothetical protein
VLRYTYHPRVLEALADHGLRPLPHTAPRQLRDAVLALYKYEIKVLRDRLLAGGLERRDYARFVEDLRRRYPLLSLPVELWTTGERSGHGTISE